ncbi:MAG: 4-hydroxy-tetrahydrodipicolinate synthase [Lachnospiraceae bacterium]|nr:4-hydroxy-tetrahydrodipicolinate synthase [Lachnospiraceae bacterium]
MPIFTGAGTAIVTPMHEDGSINYAAFEDLINDQIRNGIDAIVTVGTSGEASTLTDEEHVEAIRFTVETVHGRVPVIAGTGSNDTVYAAALSRKAQKAGADGLLLVTPYYNKATQKGLIAHFSAIASSVDIPCLLYNVPSRCGVNLLPETVLALSQMQENIVGIKEASGNISQIAHLAALTGDDFAIYSGNDDQIVPVCSLGGKGVISVLSNVAPRVTHDMVAYCLEGCYEKARTIQLKAMPLIAELFSEVNPIPVKAALNFQGFRAGAPRLPLTELEEGHKASLKQAMIDFGCL